MVCAGKAGEEEGVERSPRVFRAPSLGSIAGRGGEHAASEHLALYVYKDFGYSTASRDFNILHKIK